MIKNSILIVISLGLTIVKSNTTLYKYNKIDTTKWYFVIFLSWVVLSSVYLRKECETFVNLFTPFSKSSTPSLWLLRLPSSFLFTTYNTTDFTPMGTHTGPLPHFTISFSRSYVTSDFVVNCLQFFYYKFKMDWNFFLISLF